MHKKAKNILVITLPQGSNYGGMLQAYALKYTLGHLSGRKVDTTFSQGTYARRVVKSIPGVSMLIRFIRGAEKTDAKTVKVYTDEFTSSHLNVVHFDKAFRLAKLNMYHGYVSGSDQVWRSKYTYVPHNLLSFAPNYATKISYAASFGKDNLDEYGDKLIKVTKRFARKMNAISVREDSGVDIAKKHWDVSALHHVDPTLLVSQYEYNKLIDSNDAIEASSGNLFSYVLDPAKDKQGIASTVAKSRSLTPFTVIDGDENDGKPMPRVEQWLRSFRDANYVVTDSFHGTVFSIIFNKPFIAIGNKERGLARFVSLLRMFGLEDRLVTSADDVTEELISRPIDWNTVNIKIESEQQRSLAYLKKHLG